MDRQALRRERQARTAGRMIRTHALLQIEDIAFNRETYVMPDLAPVRADYVEWIRILADVALSAPSERRDDGPLMWIRSTAHHRDLTLASTDVPAGTDYVELIRLFAVRGLRAARDPGEHALRRLDWLWQTTTDSQQAWVVKTLARQGLRIETILGAERVAELAARRALILAGDAA